MEHLQRAYARLYRAPSWPATLDEALAHPVYGQAVRAVARRLACGAPQPVEAPPAAPPATAAPSPTTLPRRVDRFDAKSAAANDRDIP